MPYEFNPLLPDGFQKKSVVTPADISRVESEISDLQTTTTDLKQKKVTKFFSANDYLEDNEIAQYQGEDDSVFNLQNGFFYKKNPAFSITPNSDTFVYNVNKKLKIYNFDGTFFEQYFLSQQNLTTSDYAVIGLNDESIFTVCFNPALFVNNSLPTRPDSNMVFYPYLNVNGVWDFSNPVSVSGGHYYYKGNQINLVLLRAGLIGALAGADMSSPYTRYLWVSVLFSHYQAVFAFPFATNSNNELIALGVSNGLGAFGFQSHLTISSITSTTINVQGVDLTVNPAFTQTDTQEPDYYKGITIPFDTPKIGVVDICFITGQSFIEINGILVISGSFQNGNIGGTSIAVSSNYSGLTSNILVASPVGTLLHDNVVILSQEGGSGIIKVSIDFGSYNYTGGINVRFFGSGNLTINI